MNNYKERDALKRQITDWALARPYFTIEELVQAIPDLVPYLKRGTQRVEYLLADVGARRSKVWTLTVGAPLPSEGRTTTSAVRSKELTPKLAAWLGDRRKITSAELQESPGAGPPMYRALGMSMRDLGWLPRHLVEGRRQVRGWWKPSADDRPDVPECPPDTLENMDRGERMFLASCGDRIRQYLADIHPQPTKLIHVLQGSRTPPVVARVARYVMREAGYQPAVPWAPADGGGVLYDCDWVVA